MILNKKFLIFALLFLIFKDFNLFSKSKQNLQKQTAIFKIDLEKKKILSFSENVKNYMKLHFISVTTDQPIYWPDEEVFLKILFPLNSYEEVEISLERRGSTPQNLGKFKLNEAGILIEKILNGKERRLEVGEYRVDITTTDKKLKTSTTFSVVEGALGAVSFAHDFEEITKPEKLNRVKGGWFLGNASGAGLRWGNGLNVKNEIRVLNKPYNGTVLIKSRCYLPGCNGIEAGPSVKKKIKEGLLEVVLDVSSHSGPFEIEVITDKGNVRHLFSRTGHIERQIIPITQNLTNKFSATLAPYENTTPVYGRNIYIIKEKEKGDSAIELPSPICNSSNAIELIVKKSLINPKIFVFYPIKGTDFDVKEIELQNKIKKGEKIFLDCFSPYSFLAFGGFEEESGKFYEAWAILFTQSRIDVEITCPESAKPLEEINVQIKTFESFLKKPASVYAILEVFDNRVPSKSPSEPLISSIGDSFRGLSNYISTWRDWTGIEREEKVYDASKAVRFKKMMPLQAGAGPKLSQRSVSYIPSEREAIDISEPIREGEKKVVFCGIVQTNENGFLKVPVKLPPQIGRIKVRIVAIEKFDSLEKIKSIDIKKQNYVEVNIQPLLTKDTKIFANAIVENTSKEDLILKIFGAGLKKSNVWTIKPGTEEIEFKVFGENYGNLYLQLLNSQGKILDRREIEIKDVGILPTTFSDLIISDGSSFLIEKGQRFAIYSNPGHLLKGIVSNVITTMYSWFSHAEAISAGCAVRAMLLRAIEEKIIDDEGMRDTLKADLIKGVKDLYETFYNKKTNLVSPYPGIEENILWSMWVGKNLFLMTNTLQGNNNLKNEFSEILLKAKEMINGINSEMKRRKISLEEIAFYKEESGEDIVPIEIDGKVVLKVITDDAVVKWFVDKIMPVLDLPSCTTLRDININFVKAYDIWRMLRAFERTGAIYYLLLNAKALLHHGDKNFYSVFNKIAKGMILTREPGMIQGPALLGGVYSSPQTLVKFLELLILMAKDKRIVFSPSVEISSKKGKQTFSISDSPMIFENKDENLIVKAKEFVTITIDTKREINIYDYLKEKPFFNVNFSKNELSIGEEGELLIELEDGKDPTEYYAIIALPSVLSLRQTEDLLSDYKGQLLYGQKTAGGERIQLFSAPFRGSKKILLKVEGAQKGFSNGYVLVRHTNNPAIISTIKTPLIKVR